LTKNQHATVTVAERPLAGGVGADEIAFDPVFGRTGAEDAKADVRVCRNQVARLRRGAADQVVGRALLMPTPRPPLPRSCVPVTSVPMKLP